MKWRPCEPLHYKMTNIMFWWTQDFDAWGTAWLTPCTSLRRESNNGKKKTHLKRAFNISKNNNRISKSSMMCNYWLLHHEKYVWAWSRGLQNTIPALALTHHIRQQFIKAKDHAHLFWKWLTQKLKPITRSCKLWSQENVEFEENGLTCATHKSLISKTGTIIVVWLLFCCSRE